MELTSRNKGCAKGFQYHSEQEGYANKEDEKYISVRYSRTI